MNAELTLETALAALGVTEDTLSAVEREQLDKHGYLLLASVMDRPWLEELQEAFELACSEGDETAHQQTGTRHAVAIHERGDAARRVFTYPKLLAAAYQVLRRPFRMTGIGGRDPLPGYGAQGLHADWRPRELSEPFCHVNSLWMLDDFTRENGATRVVPGSHRGTGKLPRSLSDPVARHPGETTIEAPAGSVLIFNAHLLHSGTRNESRGSRRALTCSFVARDAQYYSGSESGELELGDDSWLTPAAQLVLGIGGS